ncbi:anthranilate phosphoribosyltransferase [Syntrophomonas palmitatica]|uniref:anthranilate phosphoribosyltransferase n=1 Tax=Syntrophomonas palmitatica TaxID=402877 RepID=UPI000B31E0D6|nr:anthranilate phosphoribosyltransferase [Syntrophomonas palmitatica]
MFDRYLKCVVGGESLNPEEAYLTARMLLHDNIPEVKAAAFLSAMRTRKERAGELEGFVQALYEEAVKIDSDYELIDTCGTGGDGLSTFNISTAAALVVASCGVRVAKHGNRAMTSNVGSADVLEALGVNIELNPDEARKMLDEVGITFLFAPHYHPILKQVGPLRRSLGVATIFNFLGPMLNPCTLTYQVVGIYDVSLQEAIGDTLARRGRKRALVVHGENGMDEINPAGKTLVYQVDNGQGHFYDLDPVDLGMEHVPLDSIRGADRETNARIVYEVVGGKPGPHRQTVLLNAAAALMVAGRAADYKEGMQLAAEAVDSGKSMRTLKA